MIMPLLQFILYHHCSLAFTLCLASIPHRGSTDGVRQVRRVDCVQCSADRLGDKGMSSKFSLLPKNIFLSVSIIQSAHHRISFLLFFFAERGRVNPSSPSGGLFIQHLILLWENVFPFFFINVPSPPPCRLPQQFATLPLTATIEKVCIAHTHTHTHAHAHVGLIFSFLFFFFFL